MKERKMDRRTLYTIKVIKDAFLKLINREPFARMTVVEVCREAGITRSTFYTHYNNLTELLNEVLDDALLFDPGQENFHYGHGIGREDSLLPACQRIAGSPKYRKILMDPDLSEYIISRIARHEEDKVVPQIMAKTNLSREEAETLFIYMIHGSFAVNKKHCFMRTKAWRRDVEMLNSFVDAGYKAFGKSSS